MLSTFENMLRFAANDKTPIKEKECHKQQATVSKDIHNGKYGEDIKALEDIYGDLRNQTISVELQDLLALIPRDRKRIDAYRGLKTALEKNLGCTLSITSRKTK